MQKLFLLALLTLATTSLNTGEAMAKTITFGSNKGKEIISYEEKVFSRMEAQTAALNDINKRIDDMANSNAQHQQRVEALLQDILNEMRIGNKGKREVE